MAKPIIPATDIVVIGLGRFGSAVAMSLSRLGHEVLAIDENADLVQDWSQNLTHVVQVDATNPDALRRLGVERFNHAIVAIGTDIEASVLTVLALSEIGVPDIWAKALQERHGRILERTGAHHVIYPEMSMGERVAHMVTGKISDFIEFEDGYAIVKTCAPAEAFHKRLGDSGLRSKYGVTIVGVKRPGSDFTYATADTIVENGDILIVAGKTEQVESFAAIT
ncbi:MAG: potassium channel family protein [Allosphingosinicella sp.]|uniref:potassium channel family protein n=1 Tax=Allosphingosinicella sp. TaxID=2823234 RepID=UPI00393F045E